MPAHILDATYSQLDQKANTTTAAVGRARTTSRTLSSTFTPKSFGCARRSALVGGERYRVDMECGEGTPQGRQLRDELPDVSGLTQRWARAVLHGPYCHGHEVRDQQLGVIGGTPGSLRYAQIVRQWTHDLVHSIPPDTLTTVERTELLARAIGVVEGTIDQFSPEQRSR
jgi:hypothetical protein